MTLRGDLDSKRQRAITALISGGLELQRLQPSLSVGACLYLLGIEVLKTEGAVEREAPWLVQKLGERVGLFNMAALAKQCWEDVAPQAGEHTAEQPAPTPAFCLRCQGELADTFGRKS